jgi:hypothetical protein
MRVGKSDNLCCQWNIHQPLLKENQRLSLKERQLEIEEHEIKLKRERIELLKLKWEFNIL